MPLITDAFFTKHQKEVYDAIMRGSLSMYTGHFSDFHQTPIILRTIPMIKNNDGIWEMSK